MTSCGCRVLDDCWLPLHVGCYVDDERGVALGYLFGIHRRDHRLANLLLSGFAGHAGGGAAAAGDTCALSHAFRVLVLRYLRGGGFGQHVDGNLEVGHIVAQIFRLEPLQLLVLLVRQAAPTAIDNVG